ncbi:sigma-E factor negative regulatory protein RseA [Allopseudospirillum japonicum]|uniref:Sigma-E factor negative regulatory protein RseA n=1 Tax=Allopseudospirillum japonicum TaxID=64971 RepID=A0A1H6S6B2_9GAMM|nr:sigma-E factor negative regulatory protein [Allopseudospirillum japonicum]SEI63593.1 sigma-E factor negative regulatory protein RseA [Allopseudospirillum japonicum]
MSERLRQSLSSLMDNEADDLEVRRLLNALEADTELSERWQRYHLARALLQQQAVDVTQDISAGVMQRLADEDLAEEDDVERHPHSSTSKTPLWLWVRQGAIAASVAVMLVTGVQVYYGHQAGPSVEVAHTSDKIAPVEKLAANTGTTPTYLNLPEVPSANQPYLLPVNQTNLPLSQAQGTPLQPLANQGLLYPYLLQHAEVSALDTQQGALPLLRVSSLQASWQNVESAKP